MNYTTFEASDYAIESMNGQVVAGSVHDPLVLLQPSHCGAVRLQEGGSRRASRIGSGASSRWKQSRQSAHQRHDDFSGGAAATAAGGQSGDERDDAADVAAWHDATRHDATRHDAARHDATRNDAAGNDATWHDATWHDAAWYDATWHDAARHDATYDAARHDATWNDASAIIMFTCFAPNTANYQATTVLLFGN